MSISKKWPMLGFILTICAVVFSGVGTKYLPEKNELFGEVNSKKKLVNYSEMNEDTKNINMEGRAPYLRKLPILDNNLYIEQHYNELVFGGVNFELVKFAARTDKGAKADVLRVSNSVLVLPIFDMPYLEFEYKGKFYALEVSGEIVGPESINLTYEIKPITSATMLLKAGIDYIGM